MSETIETRHTLGEAAAVQLANVTKTHAQWSGITPRWLVSFLQWVPVEAGIFRLNRVKEKPGEDPGVECSPRGDADLPETFVDYDEKPLELWLNAVTSVLHVQTRVSDVYSKPIDQIQEQLRLLIEKVKERQEGELINNADYGLLANTVDSQRIRRGANRPSDGNSTSTHSSAPVFGTGVFLVQRRRSPFLLMFSVVSPEFSDTPLPPSMRQVSRRSTRDLVLRSI